MQLGFNIGQLNRLDLKKGAKKSFTDASKHVRETGGGPPPKPPTAALMKD